MQSPLCRAATNSKIFESLCNSDKRASESRKNDLLEIEHLDKGMKSKLRNLSEENKYDLYSNHSRKVRMQDKINHLKKEFEVMFSPKNRSSRADYSKNL